MWKKKNLFHAQKKPMNMFVQIKQPCLVMVALNMLDAMIVACKFGVKTETLLRQGLVVNATTDEVRLRRVKMKRTYEVTATVKMTIEADNWIGAGRVAKENLLAGQAWRVNKVKVTSVDDRPYKVVNNAS